MIPGGGATSLVRRRHRSRPEMHETPTGSHLAVTGRGPQQQQVGGSHMYAPEIEMPSPDGASRTCLSDVEADDLRALVDLVICRRLPFLMVRLDGDGHAVVHVAPGALVDWIAVLDIPAPEWETETSDDGSRIRRTAVWSPADLERHRFRIVSTDTVPVGGAS